jgi:hypothetical protein
MKRERNTLWFDYSLNGTKWEPIDPAGDPDEEVDWTAIAGQRTLPRKVQIGVFVDVNAEGAFKAVFDQFKLTALRPRE